MRPDMHLESGKVSRFESHFGRSPTVVTRAPGRIEFIGNHIDYNGGRVLGMAIDRYIEAAASPREDDCIALRTEIHEPVEASLSDLRPVRGSAFWANYVLGVVHAFRDAGASVERGFDMEFSSTIPAGAGLSSSAALELATAKALEVLYGFPLSEERLAVLCRHAENTFVGMPCGILDQGVSVAGRRGHLVLVDCRLPRFERVPLPEALRFWVFDSNKKHRLVESLYGKRHEECTEALACLQRRFAGIEHLVDVAPDQLEATRRDLGDPLYSRVLHVIEEQQRVMECVFALERGDMRSVGERLDASHQSSRVLFENSTPELDGLVDCLRHRSGVYGARLTGGGFGGGVLAVTSPRFARSDAEAVVRDFVGVFPDCTPAVFEVGWGDGASSAGCDGWRV